MVEKSVGPNGQTDKEAALERENAKQLWDQLRLQKDQQAQKKWYQVHPCNKQKGPRYAIIKIINRLMCPSEIIPYRIM